MTITHQARALRKSRNALAMRHNVRIGEHMKKLVWLGVTLALAGCHPEDSNNIYDIKNVSNKTYLINKETGELSLVSQSKIIELPTYKIPEEKILKVKGEFSEKLQFEASTKKIEDKVYYRLVLEGYANTTKDSKGNFITSRVDFDWVESALKMSRFDIITLKLLDKDGFKLADRTITLNNNYSKYVDSSGDLIELHYEGSFTVNPLTWSKVSSLNYTYRMNFLSEAPK